jgi:type IV pilus assembly protein PilB
VTFASGLRSILRQDPNVILVGEIRDQETADIALGAAQTGHLLLSTLHTNDATATVTRLFDLGIQPFLIASSLIGIVAQRLVRRNCPSCQVPRAPSAEAIEKAGGMARLPAGAQWTAGKGCDRCDKSGMKGRIAIHEVLASSDEVRDLISARATEQAIKKAAVRAGMRTLLDDGIEKAARGLTTLEEVLRVVSPGEGAAPVVSAPAEVVPVVAAIVPETVAPPGPVAMAAPAPARAVGRVLVVEDSPTIVAVVKYFLELEGFEVFVAENGLVGLEVALRERPDIIVSDVNMPGMGGVAMVKAVRADARMAGVRIIMLTSESSIECETEGLAAGADDYILKPVEPRRLAARVRALRARSQVAVEGRAP